MRITIEHQTRYSYSGTLNGGLQQLRLTPPNNRLQRVDYWDVEINGGTLQASYIDHHQNEVRLISLEPGVEAVMLTSTGGVETFDQAGVLGESVNGCPLWFYRRSTARTKEGKALKALVREEARRDGEDPLERLHGLSARILEQVRYETGRSDADTTAEEAWQAGHGVCQDHTHIFLTVARALGFPARYVSGYLLMTDRITQEAGHAWAEAHVDGLGWVGFDVSNQQSPDERYVRLAIGTDYRDAAPVRGILHGDVREALAVEVQVQQ